MINIIFSSKPSEWYKVREDIVRFKSSHRDRFILFGKFNEIREEDKWYTLVFHVNNVSMFNQLIERANLIDLIIGSAKVYVDEQESFQNENTRPLFSALLFFWDISRDGDFSAWNMMVGS